jgi:ATP-dependent RNA helicase RhlB
LLRQFKRLMGIKPTNSVQTTAKVSQHAHDLTADKMAKMRHQKLSSNTTRITKNKLPSKSVTKKKPIPDWHPSDFVVPVATGKTRFHDLDLPDQVMQAITALGFQYCSPIQAMTLPQSLAGQDITGKAQTGTGKTAAFLISLITDLIDYPVLGSRQYGFPRALILAPTRELVMQIAVDAIALSRFTNLQVQHLVGGMDYVQQQRQLCATQVDILVATPGRLLDFCHRNTVNLSKLELLVLDEADRMLSMGFIPDVRAIIRQTPSKAERQTLLFSATFSEPILHLAQQWTHEAMHIEVAPECVATTTVAQKFYSVASHEKYPLLLNCLQQLHVKRAIVFTNRRYTARMLQERLQQDNINSALLSGEIAQPQRVKTLTRFRDGKIAILVATDVAGRGIHVDEVSHVFNYDLPEIAEDYVHRIGRTGRANKTGTSISFASEDDAFVLPELEALLGHTISCKPAPLTWT